MAGKRRGPNKTNLTFTGDSTNPKYYQGLGPYSALHIIHKWGLGFCVGTAVKYIQRAGKKPGESEVVEIRKAIWYLIRYLHEIDPKDNPDPAAEEMRGLPWYIP